jgi:CheY-like chemotaxis protein
MTAPRILVVEDEFLIRMTLSEVLSDEGFEVLEAGSAQEALDVLNTKPPVSLLLTDVQLPGGTDGTALAREARAKLASLPVVFMSGRPDTVPESNTVARNYFIAKPYRLSDICALVRRVVTETAV